MKTSTSYPNYNEYIPTSTYDLARWMSTAKDIYIKVNMGQGKTASVEEATSSWKPTEKLDFLNWLKYYEGGNHLKYKAAQTQPKYYVSSDIPNYFVPNPPRMNAPSPILDMNNVMSSTLPNQVPVHVQKEPELTAQEKRKIIEDYRRKLIGRLNSAEKLLSSHEGQMFAGNEFEKLLSAIYELKRQVQTINKRSLSSNTYCDLIIRQANIMESQGLKTSSAFLYKFAQNTPGNFNANMGPIPLGNKIDGTGTLENPLPANPGEMPPAALDEKSVAAPEAPPPSAMNDFLDRLENMGLSDEHSVEDSNEIEDVTVDEDVLLDQEIMPEDEDVIISKAQMAPPPAPDAPMPKPMPTNLPPKRAPKKDIEVEDMPGKPDAAKPPEEGHKKDVDAIIDSAFANITIKDVVDQLQEINKVYRNRELSRRLLIVDLMMDRLGIGGFFNSLSEAMNKSLDSNTYILTRIEEIISRLSSAIDSKDIDLTGDTPSDNPEVNKIKRVLQDDNEKDMKRKEVRRQMQNKELEEGANPKPELEVENAPEEISKQPAQVEAPAPVRAPKPPLAG